MVRAGLAVMSGFLLLAAIAQLNDPDTLLWMLVYGLPALVTFCACVKTGVMDSSWWWGSCIIVLSGVLLFSGVTISMYVKNQRLSWNLVVTEEGRETLGLLIVISWLLILLFSSSSSRNKGFWRQNMFLTFALVPVASWIFYKYYIQSNIDLPEHCEGVI